MTVLRCTKKLLTELHVKPGEDTDETLCSFLVCRPDRLDPEHFPELFGQGLFKALLRSGFSQDQVECMLDTTREVRYAKTNNRRVIGSMNDMAFMLECTITDRGGLAGVDPADIHRLLNETPFKAIGYDRPLKRMRGFLAPPVNQ